MVEVKKGILNKQSLTRVKREVKFYSMEIVNKLYLALLGVQVSPVKERTKKKEKKLSRRTGIFLQ